MKNNNEKFTISLNEWYEYYALEVEMVKDSSFLLTLETLERMGIMSNNSNTLYQSCHVLFKRGKYYIVHFKELFAIDGRAVNLTKEDIGRRNLIASLLEEWGIIKILDWDKIDDKLPITSIKIIKNVDRPKYEFVVKYQIGNKR